MRMVREGRNSMDIRTLELRMESKMRRMMSAARMVPEPQADTSKMAQVNKC